MLFYERVTPVNDVTEPTEVSENQYLTDVKQSIWNENAQYLRDRQFFDSNYFDFLFELLANWRVTPVKDATVPVLNSDGVEPVSYFLFSTSLPYNVLTPSSRLTTRQ